MLQIRDTASSPDPVPERVPPALVEAVRLALRDGRPITVVYGSGSRRGQARPLTVVDVVADGSSFTSEEPGDDERRTYVCSRVLCLTQADGQVVVNPAAQDRFDSFQKQLEAQRAELRRALAGTSTAWRSRFQVTPWDGQALLAEGQPFLVRNTESDRSVVIAAPSIKDAETATSLLDYLEGRGGKGRFAAAPGFLRCCFDWPVWRRLHRSVAQESRLLRRGAPRVRDLREGRDRDAIEAQRFELYKTSILRPLDAEHEFVYFKGRTRLLEAHWLDPAPARRSLDALLAVTGDPDLATQSWSTHLFSVGVDGRVHRLSEEEQAEPDWLGLEQAGLVRGLSRTDDSELMGRLGLLPQSALYRPLKARKKQIGKPDTYDHPGYTALIASLDAQTRAEVLHEIRQSPDALERVQLNPYEGWDWEDTVDFRLLFTEMIAELDLWLSGGTPHRRLAQQLARAPA